MKLYIAGHNQKESKTIARICSSQGHEITSSWLQEDFSQTIGCSDDIKRQIAEKDVSDIFSSDAVVLIASPRRIPGGKFVEVGVALGLKKPVFTLGHLENVMMYHPLIQRFDSVEDFLKQI